MEPTRRVALPVALVLVVACSALAHADSRSARRARHRTEAARVGAPSTPAHAPRVPLLLGPTMPAGTASPAVAPRSAFAPSPTSAPPLGIVARRPAGVLVGDSAIELSEAWQRAGTWSVASLTSGAITVRPAPLRVIPSGTVGVLAANLWAAGEVLVGHDETGVLLVRADGSVTRGQAGSWPTILGAVTIGTQVLVWSRLDATRTVLEALDAASARTLWQRAGPTWAWDARMVEGGGRIALLADGEIAVHDGSSGALLGRYALGALRSDIGWPHPIALGGSALVVAAPGGIVLVDPPSGAQRAVSSGLGNALMPSFVIADAHTAYALYGRDLVAHDLSTGASAWAVQVAHAGTLRLTSRHVVLCDIDGGVVVLDRGTGTALLRVGVGGCDDARERADGTLAIAGRRETWLLGPARAAAPSPRIVEGIVTLDGTPAAGLPVLLGAGSYPLDGVDGCPALAPYALCVLTNNAGRFRATVHAYGRLPVNVDLDAAAHRARRPRATGGATEVDLDVGVPPSLALRVVGAELEL